MTRFEFMLNLHNGVHRPDNLYAHLGFFMGTTAAFCSLPSMFTAGLSVSSAYTMLLDLIDVTVRLVMCANRQYKLDKEEAELRKNGASPLRRNF